MDEENKSYLRVSIMKPFPDIRLGGRLSYEVNPDIEELYGRKDTVEMKDGSICRRNEMILKSVAENIELQKWTEIVLKIVSENIEDNCLSILYKYINKDEVLALSSNNKRIAFVKINLMNLLKFVFSVKKNTSASEAELIVADKFVDAMDRVIAIQIKVSNVFTDFCKLCKEK